MGYRAQPQAGEVFVADKLTSQKVTLQASTALAVTPPAGVHAPAMVRVYAKPGAVYVEAANGGNSAANASVDSMPINASSPEWIPVGPDPNLSLFCESAGDVILTWAE